MFFYFCLFCLLHIRYLDSAREFLWGGTFPLRTLGITQSTSFGFGLKKVVTQISKLFRDSLLLLFGISSILFALDSSVISRIMIVFGFLASSFSFYFAFSFLFKNKLQSQSENNGRYLFNDGMRLRIAASPGRFVLCLQRMVFSQDIPLVFMDRICCIADFLLFYLLCF